METQETSTIQNLKKKVEENGKNENVAEEKEEEKQEESSQKKSGPMWNFFTTLLNMISEVARIVIPGLPKNMQGAFLIITFVALLLIPSSLLLQVERNRMYIISGVLLLIIALAIFIIIYNLISSPEKSRSTSKTSDNVLFQFEVPQKKIPSKDVAQINTYMQNLKLAISQDVRKLYPNEKVLKFRVNIFTFHEIKECNIQLRIPDHFNKDMAGEIDKDLSLEPGVGSTGFCFIHKQPIISIKHKKWADRFGVNNVVSKLIDPNLKWIITYPILSKKNNILAVLNIDCSNFEITDDMLPVKLENQLLKIQKKHMNTVNKISNIFRKFPRDSVSIVREEMKD